MTFAQQCNEIFDRCVEAYHVTDDIDAPVANPFAPGTVEHTLFEKNLIDARQWHMEDVIRDPAIDPVAALELKRRIDECVQFEDRKYYTVITFDHALENGESIE